MTTPHERPLADDGQPHDDQGNQAAHITETGNAPTEPDEEAVLTQLYGPCDDDGVYRGEGDDDGD